MDVASLMVPAVLPLREGVLELAPPAPAAGVVDVHLPSLVVPVALVLLFLWLRK